MIVLYANKHVIDCAADQPVRKGWAIEEHRNGGNLIWDAAQVELYLSQSQKAGKWINGHELRKKLVRKPVLNANVLDYLLVHQSLIPKEWKGKVVFFWGTIYRCDHIGACACDLDVRFLSWGIDGWYSFWHHLDCGLEGNEPAALHAS
ncbi:MAG: hypothetical protein WA435_14245 [Gallionellaceae bacterium]